MVTDWLGMPAAGLDAKDFKVLDNNQPARILSFHASDGTDQTEPPVEVILLLDALNAPFDQVALVREAMECFLRQNGGHLAQPVSIYILSSDGVSKHTEPSADGKAQAAELSQVDNKLLTLRSSTGVHGAFELFQQSIQALKNIAASQTKRPGRKLLIWASAGWQMFDTLEFYLPEMRRQYFDTIAGLSTSLREGRITLYSISTGRDLPPVYFKSFLRGVRTADQAGPGNLALGVLAEQSGGRVLGPNIDLLAQINSCVADATASYAISFDPPPTDHKSEYHDLKVQVTKPGFSARTNTGYYDQPDKDPMGHAGLNPSAPAARRMTIAQVEELLSSERGQPDEKSRQKALRL